MGFSLLFTILLILGLLRCVAAGAHNCNGNRPSRKFTEMNYEHPQDLQGDWLCPTGMSKPTSWDGNWPTRKEEIYAKELIGPVTKTETCSWPSSNRLTQPQRHWTAKGHLYQAAENAHITLSLVSKNPLTIKVRIQNTDIHPISMWKKYSPLSKEAFSLGLFKFSDTVPGITFGTPHMLHKEGYRPRNASELVQINSCASLEEDIVLAAAAEPGQPTDLNDLWYEMLKMGGNTIISMQGYWHGFWPAAIDDVMKSDLGVACKGVWDNLGLHWSSFDHVHVNFDEGHHSEEHRSKDKYVEEHHVPDGHPPAAIEAPYHVAEAPSVIPEAPYLVTKKPHTVIHSPHIVVEKPHIVIEKPDSMAEKHHINIEQEHSNTTEEASLPTNRVRKTVMF
ncbi:hypothetical protein FBEOM_2261 [Fusarium beomiforme]|uniref:Uncharacterized protein n=1 Tax=Fusarium beomiforme TaxID=44412 RepID=A0A9P5AS62_9HYPO|nr:hypothetical protein FBEOM_2261 [Fusarium beomiforme]